MTGSSDEDSHGSSSSGDLDYDSPAMSDLEDSDVETFRKRKNKGDGSIVHQTQKFLKTENASNFSTTASKKRKAAAKNKIIDNKLKRLQRNKQARLRQKDILLDDSDDDSDLDFFCDDVNKIKRKEAEKTPINTKDNFLNDTTVYNHTIRDIDSSSKNLQISYEKTKSIDLLSSSDSSPESTSAASKTKGISSTTTTAVTNPLFVSSKTAKRLRQTRSAAAAAAATDVIECLSSDDESDTESASIRIPKPSGHLPPGLAASLKQAQQAKARLEQAQEYHAHDVHVAVQATALIPSVQTVSTRRPTIPTPMGKLTMGMGKVLNLKCRCGHIVINGTKEAMTKEKQSIVLVVREKDSLSILVDRFCKAHSFPNEIAKIVMTFDGSKLDVSKTPAFYEMEDEDLIDVSVSLPRRLTAAEKQQAARQIPKPLAKSATGTTLEGQKRGSLGKSLRFSCRTQIKTLSKTAAGQKPRGKRRGRQQQQQQQQQSSKPEMVTKTVNLFENERLGVLAKRLCAILGDLPPATTKVVMRFDGILLDMEKSPKSYDMEDEDMIEVSIEKKEQETAKTLQKQCSPVGDNTTIILSLVQSKGTSSQAVSFTMKKEEPLSKLMKDFKDKHLAIGNRGDANHPTRKATLRRSSRNKLNNDSTQLTFRFRGEILDLTKTPSDYKMISLDRINVVDVTPAVVAQAAGSSTSASISQSTKSNRKKTIEV